MIDLTLQKRKAKDVSHKSSKVSRTIMRKMRYVLTVRLRRKEQLRKTLSMYDDHHSKFDLV